MKRIKKTGYTGLAAYTRNQNNVHCQNDATTAVGQTEKTHDAGMIDDNQGGCW